MLQELTTESLTNALIKCNRNPLYKVYIVFGAEKDYWKFTKEFQKYISIDRANMYMSDRSFLIAFHHGSSIEAFTLHTYKPSERCHELLYCNVADTLMDTMRTMTMLYAPYRGWGHAINCATYEQTSNICDEDEGADELTEFLHGFQKAAGDK